MNGRVYLAVLVMPDGQLKIGAPPGCTRGSWNEQVTRLIASAEVICAKLDPALLQLAGSEFVQLRKAVLQLRAAVALVGAVATAEAEAQAVRS